MLNICSGGVAEEHPDDCSEKTHFGNLIYFVFSAFKHALLFLFYLIVL
jgi:hypothetical protein